MKKTLLLTLIVCLSSLCVMGENTKKKKKEKAEIVLSQPTGVEEQHAYVDMGLSVMWATYNVGATAPEEYGEYYAWGETETKDDYSWRTYKWGKREYSLNKYCLFGEFGNVDYKMTLEPEDDAAHVKWGGRWRMPSLSDMLELIENCKWKWTKYNGVRGHLVTSKINGNCIFLPATGFRINEGTYSDGKQGSYWTSSLEAVTSYYSVLLSAIPSNPHEASLYRYGGNTIRPVFLNAF